MSVITKGLTAGTKVVVDGQSRLSVGATVEVKASGASGASGAGGAARPQGAVKK